ncbi:glycoside hydrolase family 2 protein [Filimonas effusa]|uniref:Beta-galactosidase n=1 Tax=Filimonas effusa TaxID=2508721 RepID=A0A4Q1DC86_9BACT|nr:glycoside hydrolase family 2 TIM barrel-domain containing protein [Filimonas effusa]RXK86960.1 beta-galactosidase [Filimonas effusa]
MKAVNHSILSVLLLLAVHEITVAQPPAPGRQHVSLNGEWRFALDPFYVGEREGWLDSDFPVNELDKVTVPHCFSVDKRYFFYTGNTWYFKSFDAAALKQGERAFIKFDAAFYKTKAWLNGKPVGAHEGGYTPFELEVTSLLREKNRLIVSIDNSWDSTTLPGSKTFDPNHRPNYGQLYPWMNYGGIIRPVQLIIRPAVFIENVFVSAVPDLKKGTADITLKVFVENGKPEVFGQTAISIAESLKAEVFDEGSGKQYPVVFKNAGTQSVASGYVVTLKSAMPAGMVKLWSFDSPALYRVAVTAGGDSVSQNFGIRKLEVKGTQLTLNGKPLKLGGANRPTDYPRFGSLDPDSILIKDLTLMKNGGMEFSRIAHHPVSSFVLDWADKHGMLIITEAGNWQMTPKQMADPLMRAKYQSQAKEMIRRDWNHPSVIAYSMGNEFPSNTPEAKAWVKDMRDWYKTIDSTRLITFASYYVWRDFIHQPEDEASMYVDFISTNIYGDHLKLLNHIHEVYPDKPVFLSEFGMRATLGQTDEARVNYLRDAMKSIRSCNYVVGAAAWSFNDYLSRYPGTDTNGYRSWGLITPEREPRGMYYEWQEQFAPATITLLKRENGKAVLRVTARNDFPAYAMKGYTLRSDNHEAAIPDLEPGASAEVTIADQLQGKLKIALVKPGGFTILNKIY